MNKNLVQRDKSELREFRKQNLGEMEEKLWEIWGTEKDSLFYYHSSEDRIVLSHTLYQHLDNVCYHNLNIIPTFFKGSHYKVVA